MNLRAEACRCSSSPVGFALGVSLRSSSAVASGADMSLSAINWKRASKRSRRMRVTDFAPSERGMTRGEQDMTEGKLSSYPLFHCLSQEIRNSFFFF
jgi:hypothetical protein